ncbi:MAG: tRNA uridine-5-carboxymethylaminomethyl(34) synthesis enzyme MnmG [Actinobacteria bacterium]|nr:tRNA uridine-5-carboxymethylaminomethyl(34) synthesis enzyme MnmG [Actinomycetota bacterium]
MDDIKNKFDAIVVGAGHAGCEAALACARLKLKTLLLTINIDKIALMPCNPSIGGIGKSQLVAELDALGGQMARTAEQTLIQLKILNKSKGPAVQSLRAQIDKKAYEIEMKKILENTPNLIVRQGTASGILTENKKVIGVEIEGRQVFYGNAVIITTGTFLRGRIIIGDKEYKAGRMGEYPCMNLTKSLNNLGIKTDRYQTATPPRIDKRTIDFSKTIEQPGEFEPMSFSFWNDKFIHTNISSFLTYTNKKTHEVISKNIDKSPIRSGIINTHGPRHCPSIDRKVINFPEKPRHPIFIEPEGKNTNEIYLQGLTTSMPVEFQQLIINSVVGLEDARIIRPGYAVEYDYIYPSQLNLTLESKIIDNLFFAGQINGTSGYEEAAVQGFVAGVNASLKILGKSPLILTREESYIGVLIDDLITKEMNEPYRMYTSRAEYRLLLRSDNADLRLSKYGYDIGLLSKKQYAKVLNKEKEMKLLNKFLKQKTIFPTRQNNDILKTMNSSILEVPSTLYQILKRPEISISKLLNNFGGGSTIRDNDAYNQTEINIKYEGYILKQLEEIKKYSNLEKILIPQDFDYFKIKGLTFEATEKLNNIRPNTLGQASRIAGVSPADISIIIINIKSKAGKI